MNTKLSERKEECLRAMARGTIELHPDGWKTIDGSPGCWNSHTVKWLASIRYCAIITQTRRPMAKILSAGRASIAVVDHVEYA